MSLPADVESVLPLAGLYVPPDEQRTKALEDFEAGGVAIQNSSLGLTGFTWRCWVDELDVFIQREGASAILLFSAAGIKEITFAFDQNMLPNVAYTLNSGEMFLRWYDSFAQQYRTDSFGAARNPRMTLDDKRAFQIGASDVIFAYIRAGNLCYRQQRDRYEVERVLKIGISDTIRLKNIGMNRNLRLQFELV